MKNVQDVFIVHSIPEYDIGEHIHSTKCKCLPFAEIGEEGEIIVRHRHFRYEFSHKRELEEFCES